MTDKNQFMPFLQSGLSNASAYEASGWPYITGSQVDPSGSYVKVEFGRVTKAFTVRNSDRYHVTYGAETGSAPIGVFFGPEPTGAIPSQVLKNHTYVLPDTGDEHKFNVKTTHVYIVNMSGLGGSTPYTGSFQIEAEITNIGASEYPDIDENTPGITE